MNQKSSPANQTIIEKNYEGSAGAFRVTIYSRPEIFLGHLEESLRNYGFRPSYINESTMYAEKAFRVDRPFAVSGAIKFVFFDYTDHVSILINIERIMGISWVVAAAIILHGMLSINYLVDHGGEDGWFKVGMPMLILVMTYLFQWIISRRWLTQIVTKVISDINLNIK